jgi:hypothetical protein
MKFTCKNVNRHRIYLVLAIVLLSSFSAFAHSGFKDCYAIIKPVFTIQKEAITTCAPAGPGFKTCYLIAKPLFTIHNEAIRVCLNAGPGFEDCFGEAKDIFTFPVEAITACAQK